MRILFILFICLGTLLPAQAAPKQEIRASWITTLGGLDWPSQKATSPAGIERQKKELCNILDKLQEANFNTVLFQTRLRGDVIYPSALECFAESLTGHTGQNPGYDPLKFAIEECHRRGMEIHAWMVAIPIGNKRQVGLQGKQSVVRKHPELCKQFRGSWYLDPGNPGTAGYLSLMVREIVANYDIDGIHLDYIRYPEQGEDFPDKDTYRKYGHLNWNKGYLIISIFQIVLTLVLFLSLPLWQKPAGAAEEDTSVPAERSFSSLIRVPGVKEVLICFFCYCAVESTAGMWAASYCTLFRGIDAQRAASWASLFYIGITIGRFICGFVTMKLNDQNMIRLGQFFIAVGAVLMLLPFGDSLLFIGLILIGLGCAPIYPSIIHETPANFGADLSQGIIGIQMAFAYVGTCLMPPVFGVLGQHISFGLYPVFLMAILILMVVMAERMHRVTAEKRNSYKANY